MVVITGEGSSFVMRLLIYSSHERKSEMITNGHSNTERRPKRGIYMVLSQVSDAGDSCARSRDTINLPHLSASRPSDGHAAC